MMAVEEWQAVLDGGCEWCGRKLAAFNKPNSVGYTTYGLHEAHIFAKTYAPVQRWNTFLLCPNCHTVFDTIVKPRLQQAVEMALNGFEDPLRSGRKFVVARTHEELLERLITKDRAKSQKNLKKPAKFKEWHNRKRKV